MNRAALIEDIAWLAETGVKPEQWPLRVGRTPVALARALYRAGRADLANPVEAVARLTQTRPRSEPCPECGGAVPRHNRTYCSRQCSGYAINRRLKRARDSNDGRV